MDSGAPAQTQSRSRLAPFIGIDEAQLAPGQLEIGPVHLDHGATTDDLFVDLGDRIDQQTRERQSAPVGIGETQVRGGQPAAVVGRRPVENLETLRCGRHDPGPGDLEQHGTAVRQEDPVAGPGRPAVIARQRVSLSFP